MIYSAIFVPLERLFALRPEQPVFRAQWAVDLTYFFATPVFHHWHHAAERDAVDTNFAVHTPIWDLMFGTYHLPDRWPSAYGLGEGRRLQGGWFRQLIQPFKTQ